MSESSRQGTESLLKTERGSTRIKDSVVAKIAGLAAQEVDGVHMGGGASRAASGLMQRAPGTGSSSSGDMTRGVSADVGEVEAAIDLKLDIEYGRNILATVEQVRARITDQVQYMTGLRITELNATVNDILPAGSGEGRGRRRGLDGSSGRPELGTAPATTISPEAREFRTREIRTGIREEETVEVEPRSRTHTDLAGDPAREEVRVETEPLDEGETAELRPGTGEVEIDEGGTRGQARRSPGGSSSGEGRDAFETRTNRGADSETSRGEDSGGEGGDDAPPRARRRRRDR